MPAIIAFLLFGLWGIVLKYAVEKIDSTSFSFFQTISALIVISVVFGFFWISKPQISLTKEGMYISLIAGAIGIIAVLFEASAFKAGNIAIVGPLIAVGTAAIITMGGILLFKDALTFKTGIGIILALIAIFLLST